MQIHSIHLPTGQQKSFALAGRSITLALIHADNQQRLVRDERAGALHFYYDQYNLFVTDRGSGQAMKVAGQAVQLNQPKVWLAHQELLIGDSYLLTWEASRRAQSTPGRRPGLSQLPSALPSSLPGLLGGLLFTPRFFFTYLTTVARRRFMTPLEQISPWLTLLMLALLVLAIGFLITQVYTGIRDAIATAPAPTLVPSPPVTPVRIATVTPTRAPRPKATQIPTVVLVANRADVVPSPTNTLTVQQAQALTPVPCRPSTLVPEYWDERLNRLGIRLAPACVRPDEPFWHLVEAKWLDVEASNGYHHVFVDVLDRQGARVLAPPAQFVMQWTTGQCERYMQSQSDVLGFGAHCPMFAAGSAYTVYVQGLPSDRIEGVGLGTIDQRDWSMLTSFQFKFQRTIVHAE